MTEEDKIKLLEYLKNRLSAKEYLELKDDILKSAENAAVVNDYEEMVKQIDLIYARKMIRKNVDELHFQEKEEEDKRSIRSEKSQKDKKVASWIHYPIMILISIFVSWMVFSIAFKEDKDEAKVKETTPVKLESSSLPAEDDKMKMDPEDSGVKIMGIALNRSGFYLLPYSVNQLNGVFGSNQQMTNKLPLTIIWDDKDMGLAVASFPDENLEKLAPIPYAFSKDNYFLGEEMFLIFSASKKVSINRGIIIEDSPESAFMKIHLDLQEDVYGAVVLDNAGYIVGICEKADKDSNAKVIKSTEIYKMVADMNADKGVTYIAMPTNNALRSKSNPQRIDNIKPFAAWFSSK